MYTLLQLTLLEMFVRLSYIVKCGHFHSATKALVTAYSKEISNERCREASKTLIMKNHSVLRATRIDQQSLVFLHCQQA